MNEQREIPILFTGQTVRAILDDRKTQTRRLEQRWAKVPSGTRLWVRETWAGDDCCGYVYRADHPDADLSRGDLDDGEQSIRQWRPSIFMPRNASRIDLSVVKVRGQRLWDITEEDAIAEGVAPARIQDAREPTRGPLVDAYANLWDIINGKRAPWRKNPWVFAITFKRLT